MGVTLLAIETSCDETGLAIVSKDGDSITAQAQALASQIDIHQKTGGIVPEVAAREHVSVFRPMLQEVMKGRKHTEIDGIAVTVGPGLMPALSVGVTAARTLAFAWKKPVVPVHHLEGHIYSALLAQTSSPTDFSLPANSFPALALLVSGGHTMLVEIPEHLQYTIIGQTRDDAIGEAFDKVARMLELPYPGGPHVSKLAEKGDSKAYSFTPPMLHSNDLDFSFSGLKTEVLYKLKEENTNKANIAASFQRAAITSLTAKTKAALRAKSYATLLLAGGVAANAFLRTQLQALADEEEVELRLAPRELCTDNAVMIGQAGLFAFETGRTKNWQDIDAIARMDLSKLV